MQPMRIVGVSGALGVGTLALILGSLATAEELPRGFYRSPDGAGANGRIERDGSVSIVTLGPVDGGNDMYVRESALRAQVAANLAASRSLAGSNVVVTSTNRTVVLDGAVAEGRDLDRAELIARRTPGVVGVVNQLRVTPDLTTRVEALDDAQLAKRVSERLAAEFERAHLERRWEYGYGVEADSQQLDIDADDGEVMLSGTLASYDALGRAITIARRVPGVQAVRSNVRIHVGDDDAGPRGESHVGPFQKPRHDPFFSRSRPGDRDDYND